ncbi:MAG TPA: NDP-sugar synthase [Methanobacterium sp.]|nr:MAG: NDP-sugar synthase [Methanobacterium sp.]HPX77296.1 NDP-sugar synthase [Methanobacterium sp.]
MAGGKGNRIRPLTLSRPKPLIPIANRPMIEYIVEKLKKFDVNEFVVTLSYLKDQIRNLLDKNYSDLNIKYSVEKNPLGTAGGVKKAAKHIDDTFFVLSGDVLVDVDLNEILHFHKKNKALATIVLTPVEDPSQYGIAVLDNKNQIVKFLEKPSANEVFSKIANTGTYVLEPEILDYIPTDGESDFSNDIFPQLIEENAGVYGFIHDGYWNDIGRPKTYLQANYDVLNQKIKLNPNGKKLAEGVGRLGDMWAEDDVDIKKRTRLIGPVAIGSGCVIEKNCVIGQNTSIGDNVHLEKNTTVKGSVIFPDSEVKEGSYLKNCIVDSYCTIERGSFIESGAILGSNVELGSFSWVRSKRSIYNSTVILPESIIDSDYPIVV